MNSDVTTITEFPATDLIGRVLVNAHGCEFLAVCLYLDTRLGQIVIEIDEIDLDRHELMNEPAGIYSLRGWSVGPRLLDLLPRR